MSARKKLNRRLKKRLDETFNPLATEEEKAALLSAAIAFGAKLTGKQANRILKTGKL